MVCCRATKDVIQQPQPSLHSYKVGWEQLRLVLPWAGSELTSISSRLSKRAVGNRRKKSNFSLLKTVGIINIWLWKPASKVTYRSDRNEWQQMQPQNKTFCPNTKNVPCTSTLHCWPLVTDNPGTRRVCWDKPPFLISPTSPDPSLLPLEGEQPPAALDTGSQLPPQMWYQRAEILYPGKVCCSSYIKQNMKKLVQYFKSQAASYWFCDISLSYITTCSNLRGQRTPGGVLQKGRSPGRGEAERSQPGPSPARFTAGAWQGRSQEQCDDPGACSSDRDAPVGGHPVCLQPKANPKRAQHECETSIAGRQNPRGFTRTRMSSFLPENSSTVLAQVTTCKSCLN